MSSEKKKKPVASDAPDGEIAYSSHLWLFVGLAIIAALVLAIGYLT